MEAIAGLFVVFGSLVLANNAIRNRPFGLWFFVGSLIIATGFFLNAVANG